MRIWRTPLAHDHLVNRSRRGAISSGRSSARPTRIMAGAARALFVPLSLAVGFSMVGIPHSDWLRGAAAARIEDDDEFLTEAGRDYHPRE